MGGNTKAAALPVRHAEENLRGCGTKQRYKKSLNLFHPRRRREEIVRATGKGASAVRHGVRIPTLKTPAVPATAHRLDQARRLSRCLCHGSGEASNGACAGTHCRFHQKVREQEGGDVILVAVAAPSYSFPLSLSPGRRRRRWREPPRGRPTNQPTRHAGPGGRFFRRCPCAFVTPRVRRACGCVCVPGEYPAQPLLARVAIAENKPRVV